MGRKAMSAKQNGGNGRHASNAVDIPEPNGLLARNVPMRLIDIGRSGCLLESHQRVENGTLGELKLQVDDRTFADDVRVTRCVLVEGSGSLYRVGAEFVQTRRPGEDSIRRAMTSMLRGPLTKGSFVNSARSTGEERHEKSARSIRSRG
jgi:hypothetical protein